MRGKATHLGRLVQMARRAQEMGREYVTVDYVDASRLRKEIANRTSAALLGPDSSKPIDEGVNTLEEIDQYTFRLNGMEVRQHRPFTRRLT